MARVRSSLVLVLDFHSPVAEIFRSGGVIGAIRDRGRVARGDREGDDQNQDDHRRRSSSRSRDQDPSIERERARGERKIRAEFSLSLSPSRAPGTGVSDAITESEK